MPPGACIKASILMRYLVFLPILLLVGIFVLFLWWIRGPERLAQQKPFVPAGLQILLVDFPGEANIVRYNPEIVSQEAL